MPPFPESPRCHSPFQGNLSSLQCLDFQAEDRLTPRWHVEQPCGKDSWESPVGKPHGKAPRESHRSLDPSEGKRDTATRAREESAPAGPHSRRGLTPLGRLRSTPKSMSALERNSQVPAPTPHKVLSQRDTAATAREESSRAGPHSRRGLTPLGRLRSTPRSMSALERNAQVPAPTPHKVLGPDFDGRGIPRGPRASRMGTGLSRGHQSGYLRSPS